MSDRKKRNTGALKTGALMLILGCFAVSGALRANEALQDMDMAEVGASLRSMLAQSDAPAMETPIAPSAGSDDGADKMRMAVDEAAIAAGEFATASTKSDKQDGAKDGGVALDPRPMASHRATASPDEAARLLESLRTREAELDSFSEHLRQRQLELDAAAKRIAERIRDLERSKEEFAALVASVDQAAERDVEHLVEMYQKMKPKEAGKLFNAMAPNFAAGFLGRMRADRASAIMAKMDTEKAYVVSLELAGRNVQQRPKAPAPMAMPPAAPQQ